MKRLTIVILAILATAFVYFQNNEVTAQSFQKTPPALKLGEPLPANLFVELAKAINPSVVNISTSVIPRGRMQRDPMLEMLEQFYGVPMQPQQQPGKPRRMGLGTGFIIREDGLIVTNNHVIENADIVEVQLSENDEKTYKAEVIGRDSRTDIALIKIKPDTKLTVAVMGTSEDAQVGEWVAAFGNPYGHGHTMTKGIISSKGRAINEINKFPLIQTDASINPGNSGGPLVNSKGVVIGVNSAIDARAQGIGFAIPIDEVKKIIPTLEKEGKLQKGYIGIAPGDLDYRAAMAMGLDEYRGAAVLGLGEGPAKKAGMKVYDIIQEINGKKIRDAQDLMNTIADIEPGTKTKFKVLRNEKTVNLDVTVAERPSEKSLSSFFKRSEKEEDQKSSSNANTPYNLGIKISDMTDALREDYNLEDSVKNPMITWVDRGSIGSSLGLRVGDVVLGINKVEPTSAEAAIKAIKKGTNTIRVARGRGITAITFDLK
ncbi:trypsin-like peptidase domain-containing protein [Pseudobdellovibrio sp. HCB154]|uniref:trypsin-like peptidase domain-containing protein n=1 Tax=Pseudobdellovibrio sp. HCB154 TaxID=3386277 RepID=UPI003916FB3B